MYVFVGTSQSSATHRQHPDSNPSNPACAGRPSTPSIRAWGMAECVADDRLELSHIVCRRRSMTSKPTSLQQTSLAAYFSARSQPRCARTTSMCTNAIIHVRDHDVHERDHDTTSIIIIIIIIIIMMIILIIMIVLLVLHGIGSHSR